ncbi:hypothetical protein SERLA73DRAFT_186928 [Serpula lacrymans var. lacrymans S7.3]|uniref:Uncharacterized protein n=1 Tax=Serpula lacrymans var. lacrymans (strain S7.3) TaxID=936435 RepID=F8Q852_SERL3|nr:hypothetical protein SERLA73DRAFT_186928 [Serpula lacrymans var. lacrymans S7.3]
MSRREVFGLIFVIIIPFCWQVHWLVTSNKAIYLYSNAKHVPFWVKMDDHTNGRSVIVFLL